MIMQRHSAGVCMTMPEPPAGWLSVCGSMRL